MRVLRTPEERFTNLPGFDFEPRFVDVPDNNTAVRVHYVDEGPTNGEVVLLLHGEPSWSFLYRKVIPVLVDAGLRAVAPDLVGFGRSDKPSERSDYSYARHVEWMRSALLDKLGLTDIILVGQDWGGLIGLRLVAEHPDRFTRVVVANTGLPTGDQALTDAFMAWQRFSQETREFPVGQIVAGGCATKPSAQVIAAYDAPFPDESFKEGARMFPVLVPTTASDPAADANRRAWDVLGQWDKPFLTAFSDGDPITSGGHAIFQRTVPGAAGLPHTTINGGGHFLQEDKGEELGQVVVDFVRMTAR